MTGECVLILAGTTLAAVNFARRYHEELGITQLAQVISVTQPYQVRGHRGERLIVLQDIYTRAPRWYELIAYAREAGLVIEYHNYGGGYR